jgi:hypothetical protein
MHRVTILLLSWFVLGFAPATAQGNTTRRLQAEAVALEINGRTILLRGVSGGDAAGDVIALPGPDRWLKKRVGNLRFEPLHIQCEPNDLLAEVRKFFAGDSAPLNFNVLHLDSTRRRVVDKMVVSNAMITKIEIGDFNAENKDLVIMTITLLPGSVQLEQGGGDVQLVAEPKGKRSTGASFQVKIPGIETRGVISLGTIAIEQKGSQEGVGRPRAQVKTAASGLDAANLHFQVARTQTKDFSDWARSFLVEGKRTDTDEKTLTVELLTPDMKTVLLTLEASGVGLVAMRASAVAGSTDRLAEDEVELYVDRWSAK